MAAAASNLPFRDFVPLEREEQAADFARTNTPVVMEEETPSFLLLVSLKPDGAVVWTPETRETLTWVDELGKGPFLLDADETQRQVITPEAVGVTQDQIRAWMDAADRFSRYCESCGNYMDDEQEMRSWRLEQESDALYDAIANLIKDMRDTLKAAGKAMKDE